MTRLDGADGLGSAGAEVRCSMSRPVLDFYFEFASTYSYPAAMRVAALAQAAGVTLRWRPFLLGPIFQAQGLNTSPFNLHPAKGRYMWRDVARICARLDLPLRRPDPFPQPTLLAARLAHVGLDEGWGEAFCRAVYAAEFGEGRAIGEAAVLHELLQGLGVAPEAALARAGADDIKARLRTVTAEAERAGVFGAPSFVASDGELFWGQDRMAEALAWAVRHASPA
jgi:2-hydroxychromene-2-carboxylate isomerase